MTVAEWGRKFLPTSGASVYIDAHHLEINTPEVASPADYVAAWRAMLRVANAAREAVNLRLRTGLSVEVLANTSDRKSNSFGAHLSMATSRTAWQSLFESSSLLWLASFHASSILYAGAGKAGSENGQRPATFQLSERSDFFGQLTTMETTIPNRGLVNQRDETLCGPERERARYHCIFYDSNLMDVAAYLKAGVLALIMLLLEAGEADTRYAFDDPVAAMRTISRDLTFRATFPTVAGKRESAIGLQRRFLDRAAKFVEAGSAGEFLPDSARVIKTWAEVLDLTEKGNLAQLSRRLDWALKLSILSRLMETARDLDWTSPEVQFADLQYANLDPQRGLFWAYYNAGQTERLVEESRIAHLEENPPENTRAYARAMLLRRVHPGQIREVSWDSIIFCGDGARPGGRGRTLRMNDPRGMTKQAVGDLFQAPADLEEILDAMERRSHYAIP
jgi:proteasome accessory factor A